MPGITNPTEGYFKDGNWGWDGTQWRKGAIPFAYTSQWYENLGTAAAAGGIYTQNSTAVPAGYIYVIQAMSIENETGARGMARLYVRPSGLYCCIGYVLTPAQYQPTFFTGQVVLKAGDIVTVQQFATVAGDDIRAVVIGYKVAIV